MERILIFLRKIVDQVLRVDASPFTAGHAEAAFGSSQIGTRTAEVHAQIVE